MVTLLEVVPATARFDGLLGDVGIVGTVDVAGGGVVGGVVVGLEPSVAVSTGVVIPLPRTEYRYGVSGNSPMSVKLRPVTVAIRCPDRSTS